jgi:hypothetical protein
MMPGPASNRIRTANSSRGTRSKQNRHASRSQGLGLACCGARVRHLRRARQAQPALREQQDAEVDLMATVKLDKGVWQTYFDRISTWVMGKQAEIEVASLKLGNQIEAAWMPLPGITYDPKNEFTSTRGRAG